MVSHIDPKGRKLRLATPLGKVDILSNDQKSNIIQRQQNEKLSKVNSEKHLKVDILDKLADVRLKRGDCQGLWADATELHRAKPAAPSSS